jgi:hypothetical protein
MKEGHSIYDKIEGMSSLKMCIFALVYFPCEAYKF